MNERFVLPGLEPDAAAHSARLAELIRSELAAGQGLMPFSRFMELALYAPGLGYYSAGARRFGAGGDYVTAPEISPLFSRCLARQCRQVLARTGGDILELGAGSGTMAADILLELETLNGLPEHYRILEISGALRAQQQETLSRCVPHLLERVVWLDGLPASGLRGVIIGNEVLDALPVQRFRLTRQGPRPLGVAWHNERFVWRIGAEDPLLSAAVNEILADVHGGLPIGYEAELNPLLSPWLASLADSLADGLILLIDYGYPRREYYHPQRVAGTLLCHYRHRVHDDPLILPGLQDITASVDFTAVAAAALAAGLAVAGYTRQSHFLFGCGLAALLAEIDPADQVRYLEYVRQVKLLTLPGEMGERCKAIALTKGLDLPLLGFTWLDERGRL
jgi:SAM-dependent MidA family methyltransferase